MHPSLLLNEQLFKIKTIWLKHGWTLRKRGGVKSWKDRQCGWKHSWNVPCTSPSVVGGARCWAAPPGNLAGRIYLWGEERSWFGQLFLEVLGKHLETLHNCASQLPFTNVWGVIAIPGVWKMWGDLLQRNTVLSQHKHSNLVWYDTLCL